MTGINRITIRLFLITLVTLSAAMANPTLPAGTWVNITPNASGLSWNGSQSGSLGVAVAPSNPSIIYLCVYGSGCQGSARGLYKTTDGGSNWTDVHHFDSPNHVAVDPDNPNNLYVTDGVCGGTNGFWKSTDGGANWAQPAGYMSAAAQVNGGFDMYSVAVDPTDFKHLLLTSHQCCAQSTKIIESFDGGATAIAHDPVANVNSGGGFNVFFLYNPGLGIGDSHTWLFMTQDGGSDQGWYRTTNSGTSWTKVNSNSMCHGGNEIYYTKTGMLYAAGNQIRRSSDNGVTWQTISGTPGDYYYSVYGDGTKLYACRNSNSAFLTSPESDGLTWTNTNSPTFFRGAYYMAFDDVNKILYNSCWEGGLWALKTAGTTEAKTNYARSFAKPSIGTIKIAGNGYCYIRNSVNLYNVKGELITKSAPAIINH